MSPLFQLVLFNFLFRWPPLFGRTFYSTTGFIQQLVLFNFLFRWPPLFGRTFYSTTQLFILMAALIWSHFLFNNWFYSTTATAYSLSLIPTNSFAALFNFLFRWPPLFIFIQLFILFNLNGCPYLVTLILLPDLLFFFFFFFLWKKRCLRWDSNPGPLDLQSGYLDR